MITDEKLDVDLDSTIEEPCIFDGCPNVAVWCMYLTAKHDCDNENPLLLCGSHFDEYVLFSGGIECKKCLALATITHTERIR